MADNKDLLEKIENLNNELTGFIELSREQFTGINAQVEEIRRQTTATNGKVSNLTERMEDVEAFNRNCPAMNLEESLEKFKNEMTVWIFFSKHWKSVAAFLGIMAGSYAALSGFVDILQRLVQ